MRRMGPRGAAAYWPRTAIYSRSAAPAVNSKPSVLSLVPQERLVAQ